MSVGFVKYVQFTLRRLVTLDIGETSSEKHLWLMYTAKTPGHISGYMKKRYVAHCPVLRCYQSNSAHNYFIFSGSHCYVKQNMNSDANRQNRDTILQTSQTAPLEQNAAPALKMYLKLFHSIAS